MTFTMMQLIIIFVMIIGIVAGAFWAGVKLGTKNGLKKGVKKQNEWLMNRARTKPLYNTNDKGEKFVIMKVEQNRFKVPIGFY